MDHWSLASSMPTSYTNVYEYLTNFFMDWHAGNYNTTTLNTCRDIINNKKLSGIDLQSLNPTEQTLDLMYENICKELFRYQYKTEYVITLLAFSIQLERQLEKQNWYTTEKLVETLTKQLLKTDFDPNTMDNSKFFCSSYLINIPALFLSYFIQRWSTNDQ